MREDRDALVEVRRAFHTLKGSGRMVRALVIGELAWSVENLLNRVLDRSVAADAPLFQVINEIVALMPSLVDEYAASAQRQRDDVDLLAARAHALAKGEPLPVASQQAPEAEQPEPITEQALEAEEVDVGPEEIAPANVADSAEEVLDPQLLEIFRNEAESHLETLGAFLARCQDELPQPVTDDLQRALHTLKGSAFMAGILPIAEIAAPLEKLAKEFKANLIQVDMAERDLLGKAQVLFTLGVEQLETDPLRPIDGTAELLEEIQQLHSERLDAAENARQSEQGEVRDPQLISIFLAEGMDILLDAEELLKRWRQHPSERQELSALLDELTTLARGADMAELPQISQLCNALLDLYGAVGEGRLAVSERFFDEAEKAHEVLIGMMDQVAAGLQVSAQPAIVDGLRALLDEAFDPSTLALLEPGAIDGLEVIEMDVAPVDEPSNEEPATETTTDDAWAPVEDLPLAAPQGDPAESPESLPLATSEAEQPAAVEQVFPLEALDEEMVEIFLEEAVDILESAGQALERWLAEPDNQHVLSSLQRDLHTLKGGARMAEITPIGDLAHELESLYEGLVDRRYSHSPRLEDLLQRSHDRLALLLDQLQARTPMQSPADLVQAIRQFRQGGGAGDLPVAVEEPEPAGGETQLSVDDEWSSTAEPLAEAPTALEAEAEAEAEVEEIAFELPVAADEPEQLAPESVEEPADAWAPLAQVEQPEPQATRAVADDRDPELVEIFLEEGFDIIESSGAALQRWMDETDNTLEVESLQRDLHTLKGGARMAEIREIGDLAHELEFLYEDLGEGRLRASPELFTLLQTCHDRLAQMLEAVRDHQPLPDGQALIDTIKRFRSNPEEQLSIPASVHLKAAVDDRHNDTESDILDIFLEEGDDLLEALEAAIGKWEQPGSESAALDEMLRVLHTLKGGARLAGQRSLGDMSHDLEQVLTEAQQRGAPWPQSLTLDIQSGFEGLQKELDELRQRLSNSHAADLADEATPELTAEAPATPVAQVSLAAPIVAASSSERGLAPNKVLPFVQRAEQAAQEAASRRAPQELVKVPADLLEGLVNLAGETSIFRGRVEQQVSDFSFTLSEMEATIDRVRDQLRRLDTETQAQILSRFQAEAERVGYEDFDPLEMDRHSQLQQLSRALFESASDLLDLKETLAARNRDAETLLLQQARVNTELQEGLMRTRMVPFDRLVPRLRRIVRQIAGELGKQVEFVVGNADGEMDRTVLERIVAPLEHMLRNAVDHGIESADARLAAGKPAAPAAADPSIKLVTSPMVGTYYATPSPENPPFVTVGSPIKADSVVCIIEAMKVMNEIQSEISGTVVECLVANGTSVEFGQPLFRVKVS